MSAGGASPELILLFLFFSLVYGIVVQMILKRQTLLPQLPYTVVLFLSGILIGYMVNYSGHGHEVSDFDVSVHMWTNISPHLLLFAFLPALLFGDAMELNIRHAKRSFVSSFIMAMPGATMGTFIMAGCIHEFVPYNWDWPLCYTLGAVLAATDPVSVIALLKHSGASHSLKITIELEALMNDGAALVLFNLFFNDLLIHPEENIFNTPGRVALYFVKVLTVSPLIGIVAGLVTAGIMELLNKRLDKEDTISQIVITISCAYLSFFVAEHTCEASGVLACVAAGVVLSWLGPAVVLDQGAINEFWESIGWICNTLIFLIGGLLIGNIQFDVTGTDIGVIILVYVLTQVIRGVMVIFFYPFLQKLGYGMKLNDALFITFAGVRGAIAITLALIIDVEAHEGLLTISNIDSKRAFLIVGGVASLTLFINGTCAQPLLYALQLLKADTVERSILQHYARKRIQTRVMEKVHNMPKNHIYFTDETQAQLDQTVQERMKSSKSKRRTSVQLKNGIKAFFRHRIYKPKGKEMSNSGSYSNLMSISGDSSQGVAEEDDGAILEDDDLMDSTHGDEDNNDDDDHHLKRFEEHRDRSVKNKVVNHDLLHRLRESFYDLVRAAYWKQVEEGSLKKGSYSAISLLYALDIRLDHLDDDESHDFKFLEPSFEKQTHHRVHVLLIPLDYIVAFFYNAYNSMTGSSLEAPVVSKLVESEMDYYHDEYVVSVLTNYISAHKYSQRKAPHFLGDDIIHTVESQRIIQESVDTCEQAEAILQSLDPKIVEYHVLRQVSSRVITLQEEMINQFLEKGVLFPMDASILIDEVDAQRHSLKNEHWFFHSYAKRDSIDGKQSSSTNPNLNYEDYFSVDALADEVRNENGYISTES